MGWIIRREGTWRAIPWKPDLREWEISAFIPRFDYDPTYQKHEYRQHDKEDGEVCGMAVLRVIYDQVHEFLGRVGDEAGSTFSLRDLIMQITF